jgi:hypothetical protein
MSAPFPPSLFKKIVQVRHILSLFLYYITFFPYPTFIVICQVHISTILFLDFQFISLQAITLWKKSALESLLKYVVDLIGSSRCYMCARQSGGVQ